MASNLQHLLPFEELGNFDSNNMIVFLHGYPDTSDIWHSIANKVSNDAFILNFSYPNFSEKSSSYLGLNQGQIIHRMKLIIDVYQKIKKRDITVVAHDWGAILAYILDKQNPGLVKEMITLDVSAYVDTSNKKVMKAIMSYQLKLIFAFMIGLILPFAGTWLTKKVVEGQFKYFPPHQHRISWKWNYLYFYYIVNMIVSKFKPEVGYLHKYVPSVPVVYVYGEQKPFQFHSPKWIEYLQKTKGCELHAADCDHWIPQKKEDFVVSLIKRRLSQK